MGDQTEPTQTPGAQTPLEPDPANVTAPPKNAAGIPALIESTRFVLREMGVARGLKTLLKLNQKNGFDCQSCAWPSPDDHRQVAEFCENGVKAVSDEATTKRVTPEFFASTRSKNCSNEAIIG